MIQLIPAVHLFKFKVTAERGEQHAKEDAQSRSLVELVGLRAAAMRSFMLTKDEYDEAYLRVINQAIEAKTNEG